METKATKTEQSDAEHAISPEKNATCDACGKPGAHRLGDGFLCVDCYHESGSCCALESE